jgi:hypothetical protein
MSGCPRLAIRFRMGGGRVGAGVCKKLKKSVDIHKGLCNSGGTMNEGTATKVKGKAMKYLLPPEGYVFYLCVRRIQVDDFNTRKDYGIVAYDAQTLKKVRVMAIAERDASSVCYRDSSGGLVVLELRGQSFPKSSKTPVRLYYPQPTVES